MCISAYMSSVGVSLMPSDAAIEGLVRSLDELVPDFVDDYVAQVGEFSFDTFTSTIEQGCIIRTNGLLQVGQAAASLMGRFTAWLIEKFGLIGEDGTPVTEPVIVYDGTYYCVVNGETVRPCYDSAGNLVYVFPRTDDLLSYTFDTGYTVDVQNNYNGNSYGYIKIENYEWKDAANSAAWGFSAETGQNFCYLYSDLSSVPTLQGSVYFTNNFGIISGSRSTDENVAVEIDPHYESVPTVEDQHAMVINNGISYTDEQSYIDAVLGGVAAGTLAPTYAIENVAEGDVTVPDEGTDTDDVQVSILDWTKKIWQTVTELPGAIADAIADAFAAVFSPDPELVNEITGTFSEKFGFVETLKRVGDDLFGMSASADPPVVWIHLEDAEGRYIYGGTVKALDMSWYQRYKPDMDRILSGFLWIAYLWLLFRRLPDIISGAGLVIGESRYLDDGFYVDDDTGEVVGHFKFRRSKHL